MTTPRPWPQPTAHCLPAPPRPPCRSAQVEGVLDGPISWENAELIVRAVNSHEKLLAALKNIQGLFCLDYCSIGPHYDHDGQLLDEDHHGYCVAATNVIAKAEEEA